MRNLILALAFGAFLIPSMAHANHDMWAEKDANNDGMISKAEATAYHNKKFDMMDTNKDGNLSKDEAMAHKGEMKKKWQEMKAKVKDKVDNADVAPADNSTLNKQ